MAWKFQLKEKICISEIILKVLILIKKEKKKTFIDIDQIDCQILNLLFLYGKFCLYSSDTVPTPSTWSEVWVTH